MFHLKNVIMGGEGSMMAAIKSLQNNRNLLKRQAKQSSYGSYAHVKLKNFPKASKLDLLRIQKRMKIENARIKRKQIMILLFLLCVLLAFMIYILK